MNIRHAQPNECTILTEIALKSKAHWGYTKAQLDSWTDELTTREEDVQNFSTYVVLLNGSINGFYALCDKTSYGYIDKFFITPNNIGTGLGNKLMSHLLKTSKQNTYSCIKVHADPNAEQFYKKYGFETFDYLASTIKGRFLPHMRKNL